MELMWYFWVSVMPFGLTNAPEAFQCFINNIWFDLLDIYVVVHLDEILIYLANPMQHLEHVWEVLSWLRKHDLFCKPKKCEYHANTIEYLGFVVRLTGIMDKKKNQFVLDWPEHWKLWALQYFLGFANIHRHSLYSSSDITHPPHHMCSLRTAGQCSTF